MKKQLIPLALVSLLLVGCGSSTVTYTTDITDGDKTALSVDGITVTNKDIYDYLLSTSGASEVLTLALTYIGEQEITDADAIQAKLDETVASYTQYSTSLDTLAASLGYASADDYINGPLKENAIQQMLQEKYIDQEYDSLVEEYNVKYIKTITLDTESAAQKIIDEATDEAKFNEAFDANSGTDDGMITNESTSVDENIIAKLDDFTKDGVYSSAIKTSDSKYVVVYVYNTDKSNLKDDIKTNLTSISDIASKCEGFYLKKYNFTVNEQALKDEINEANEGYAE